MERVQFRVGFAIGRKQKVKTHPLIRGYKWQVYVSGGLSHQLVYLIFLKMSCYELFWKGLAVYLPTVIKVYFSFTPHIINKIKVYKVLSINRCILNNGCKSFIAFLKILFIFTYNFSYFKKVIPLGIFNKKIIVV